MDELVLKSKEKISKEKNLCLAQITLAPKIYSQYS